MKLLLFQRYMTNFPMLSSQTSIMAPPPSFWGMMLPSFYCHFALKQLNWLLKQLCENCFPWFRALVSSTYLLFSGQPRSAIAHTMGWTNFWRIILISNPSSFSWDIFSNLHTFIAKKFIEHGQSRIPKVILKILISLDRN